MAKKNKESTRKRQDKIQSLDFQKKKNTLKVVACATQITTTPAKYKIINRSEQFEIWKKINSREADKPEIIKQGNFKLYSPTSDNPHKFLLSIPYIVLPLLRNDGPPPPPIVSGNDHRREGESTWLGWPPAVELVEEDKLWCWKSIVKKNPPHESKWGIKIPPCRIDDDVDDVDHHRYRVG